MRSGDKTHIAGSGINYAFVEYSESYCDRKVHVRLPSDEYQKSGYAELCGPVTTYNIYTGGHSNVNTHSN